MQFDFIWYMFIDFFNEEKSLEGCVSCFVYYCDMLLQEYKDNNLCFIDNNYYYDDNYQMVLFYLVFWYFDWYVYYEVDVFWSMLEKLGSI